MLASLCLTAFFCPKGMNKVLSQLLFGDQHYGGVAYRSIREAFPNAVVLDNGRVKQRHGCTAPEFALVGIKSAYTCDERIVFRTQLNEECNLKLNCREYKQCTIDMVPLPVRAPSSEEDVGDLVLIKVEESTASGQGVCEGVLISKKYFIMLMAVLCDNSDMQYANIHSNFVSQ